MMLETGYERACGTRVRGAEIAFWAEDVAVAFDAAVRAGAIALTPPHVMPWGQTVAYAEAPEGTILGFVTRVLRAQLGRALPRCELTNPECLGR